MHGASSNNKHGGDARAVGHGNNTNEVSGPSTLTNQQLPGKFSPYKRNGYDYSNKL